MTGHPLPASRSVLRRRARLALLLVPVLLLSRGVARPSPAAAFSLDAHESITRQALADMMSPDAIDRVVEGVWQSEDASYFDPETEEGYAAEEAWEFTIVGPDEEVLQEDLLANPIRMCRRWSERVTDPLRQASQYAAPKGEYQEQLADRDAALRAFGSAVRFLQDFYLHTDFMYQAALHDLPGTLELWDTLGRCTPSMFPERIRSIHPSDPSVEPDPEIAEAWATITEVAAKIAVISTRQLFLQLRGRVYSDYESPKTSGDCVVDKLSWGGDEPCAKFELWVEASGTADFYPDCCADHDEASARAQVRLTRERTYTQSGPVDYELRGEAPLEYLSPPGANENGAMVGVKNGKVSVTPSLTIAMDIELVGRPQDDGNIIGGAFAHRRELVSGARRATGWVYAGTGGTHDWELSETPWIAGGGDAVAQKTFTGRWRISVGAAPGESVVSSDSWKIVFELRKAGGPG